MIGRVIHLHAAAPPKPALGQACNGCGVCCAAEPCPAGMAVSLRRSGACSALTWDDAQARYRCGLLDRAAQLGTWPARAVARWIAAGHGCDADIDTAAAD